MLEVIKAYPLSLYVDNGEVYTNPQYEPLMKYLVKTQIPYAVGRAGKIIPFTDGVTISITHPAKLGKDVNENSLALLITYGTERFFFTGDCEICDADAQVVNLLIMDKKDPLHERSFQELNQKRLVSLLERTMTTIFRHPQ
jgi:beta-lactamase superfamily II metal-dependent hydrolase